MQSDRSKVIVLGIETSCDETAAAVYDTARGLRSHCLFSQVATHAPFGGVVPELASRDHIRKLLPIIDTALSRAGVGPGDLSGVAYTAGPGLVGALLGDAGLIHHPRRVEVNQGQVCRLAWQKRAAGKAKQPGRGR